MDTIIIDENQTTKGMQKLLLTNACELGFWLKIDVINRILEAPMTHEERLKWCRSCTHKQADLRSTYICGLTGQMAAFEGSCTSFHQEGSGAVSSGHGVNPPLPGSGQTTPPPPAAEPATPPPVRQPQYQPYAQPSTAYRPDIDHNQMEFERQRKKANGRIISGSIMLGAGLILAIVSMAAMGTVRPLTLILAVFGLVNLIIGLNQRPNR